MLKIVTVKIHLDNGSTGIETLIKKACLLLFGDKLSRTRRAKIKFRGYKLSRTKKIWVEVSSLRAIFSEFVTDIS